ncbi:MAG: alpha/beta hydrolase [bacterium]|nr:alpha/beta hydrolase [bacterium]
MPLHPTAKALLKEIADNDAPGWSELPVDESRQIFNSFTDMFGTGPELAQVQQFSIHSELNARLYRPEAAECLPAIVYFHGGGWVLGNLDTHDALCRRLSQQSGSVVISVDYRLAPEARYPAAFDDCYLATRFVAEQAEQLGIDAERLSVAGDSAGGNLAAAVAIKARDENGPKLNCQILVYPVIQPDFQTQSYRDYGVDHMLTRDSMEWFWKQYLGDLSPATIQAAPFAAILNQQLEDLPPSLILTAEYDVLRSEAEHFAHSLRVAGNQVTLKTFEGMLHGFVHFGGIFDDGIQAIEFVGQYLRQSQP